MRIADISIKQPVFITMVIAMIVVLGVRRLHPAGRRPHARRHAADHRRLDPLSRRRSGGSRAAGHQAHRGRPELDQRPRQAEFDVVGGRLGHRRPVQARKGRPAGGQRVPGQDLDHPGHAAPRHPRADHRQVRPLGGADPVLRDRQPERAAEHGGAPAARRRRDQAPRRARGRGRPGQRRRRPRARDQGQGGQRQARRSSTFRWPRSARPSGRKT